MIRLLKRSLITVSLIINSLAIAAPSHFNNNLDYTSDTLSGLDWLDVTLTAGLSRDQVLQLLQPGGVYTGWRYATGTEFIALVDNFTDANNAGNYGHINQETDKVDALVVLLGSTYDTFALDKYGKTYDEILGVDEGQGLDGTVGLLADNDGLGGYYGAIIHDYDHPDATGSQAEDYSLARSSNTISSSTSDTSFGSFLVRNSISAVPVPAAALLFAPALLGLVGFRLFQQT